MRYIYKNHYLIINTLLILFLFSSFICSSRLQAEETPSLANGEKVYKWYCTSCHGIKGDGKGFNAKNLDPRPSNHTDSVLMDRRSDDDLHDVIEGGGKAVGKSTLMPPWGNTFTEIEIESLILYLRTLSK